MDIIGYLNRLSFAPGETVRARFSTDAPEFTARLVRIFNGDASPLGPGVDIRDVASALDDQFFEGRVQELRLGSHLVIEQGAVPEGTTALRLSYSTRPTLVEAGHDQTVVALTQDGAPVVEVRVDDAGALVLVAGGHAVQLGSPAQNVWLEHELVVESERVTLSSHSALGQRLEGAVEVAVWDRSTPVGLVFAASPDGDRFRDHYNGRVDSPVLSASVGSSTTELAEWDFGPTATARVFANRTGEGFGGRSQNFPVRACLGPKGAPRDPNPKLAPEGYNAIHFHDDDLDDAGWEDDVVLTLDADLASGVYGIHVEASDGTDDVVPFVVTPSGERESILFVMPTLSYLAYSCESVMSTPVARDYMEFVGVQNVPEFGGNKHDAYLAESGLRSVYDTHTDASGVCFASTQKPLPNMRPDYRWAAVAGGQTSPHQFSADLHLVQWLTDEGFAFDIITDEEVHHGGVAALAPYRVVLTGSHPEYPTVEMVEAYQEYTETGGRLMYLGGNGFYWVTSIDSEEGHTMEVRKSAGICAWQPEPGEWHHQTTGEWGGLWRLRGLPPQKLVGVGMTAAGWEFNRPYTVECDPSDPRVAFAFDGVDIEDGEIGNFESMVNGYGAAGIEIDRMDHELGTPLDAITVATARGFNKTYGLDPVQTMLPDGQYDGTTSERVRTDLMLVPKARQGAIFATGSIAWCGSLLVDGRDNNVSRLTGNVLRAFAADGDLPFGRD